MRKNGRCAQPNIRHRKGTTPMTANGSGFRIRVFDADGHQIGETYPKRARGLVKHGRAVWLTETSYAEDPDEIYPDLLLFPRGGDENLTNTENMEEPIMSEYNNEHEQRIHDMIARFRVEMAKAREIAEKAAAEAENVIREVEKSGVVEKAAAKAEEAVNTVKAAFTEHAPEAAEDLKAAADEVAEGTADATDDAFESAKRAFEEAEANFETAKRAFEEAQAAKEAEGETKKDSILDEELCRQAKENIEEIRREAKDALTVAWEELKKGWAEFKNASGGSVEWLKGETKAAGESLKEAFREMKENLRAMMDDLGDAGDEGTERTADPDAEAEWIWEEGDEEEPADEAEPAPTAEAVRANIEGEMNDVQRRVTEMLELVRREYDAGNIGFEKYVEYTDKYTAYLHERLVELREEMKKL